MGQPKPGSKKRRKWKPFVQRHCKTCNAPVRWAKRASGQFVVVDVKGGRHECQPVTAASFETVEG